MSKPVRLGWRGPLPSPRITPVPVLGQFLEAAGLGASPSREIAGAPSSLAVPVDQGGEERVVCAEAFQIPGCGARVGIDRSPPSPWEYLGRRFRALWRWKEADLVETSVIHASVARSLHRPLDPSSAPPSSPSFAAHPSPSSSTAQIGRAHV